MIGLFALAGGVLLRLRGRAARCAEIVIPLVTARATGRRRRASCARPVVPAVAVIITRRPVIVVIVKIEQRHVVIICFREENRCATAPEIGRVKTTRFVAVVRRQTDVVKVRIEIGNGFRVVPAPLSFIQRDWPTHEQALELSPLYIRHRSVGEAPVGTGRGDQFDAMVSRCFNGFKPHGFIAPVWVPLVECQQISATERGAVDDDVHMGMCAVIFVPVERRDVVVSFVKALIVPIATSEYVLCPVASRPFRSIKIRALGKADDKMDSEIVGKLAVGAIGWQAA